MADISNKTLAVLLLIAIAISFVGFLIVGPARIRGAYDATGNVSVNITNQTSIILDTATIDFGSGYVTKTSSSCTLNSTPTGNTSADCTNFDAPTEGFKLRNDGNINVSVDITGSTAASLIGGTTPTYKFRLINVSGEEGACTNTTVGSFTSFTGSAQTICESSPNGLLYTDSTDTVEIQIELTIPNDAATGARTDTITFTATAV